MKLNQKSLVIVALFSPLLGFAQTKESTSEKQKTFQKMRSNDFTKLIGGIQEGVRVNYNTEKANIEGSVAKELAKSKLLLQGSGSLGTTTNLSSLFSNPGLPTFTAGLSGHKLFTSWSTWYYDGTFNNNFAPIEDQNQEISTIDTKVHKDDSAEKLQFRYKPLLREKVKSGKLTKTERLYTFKRFIWGSLAAKFENSKYQFFDGSRSFDDQLYKAVYESWSGKASMSGYFSWNKADIQWVGKTGNKKWRPNFIFCSFSVQYGLGSNVQQLEKTNVNDISASTVSGNSTRQIVESTIAYDGIYKEFNTVTPSFEVIISPIKSVALNIFGDYNIINETDSKEVSIGNYGSIATGLYFYGNGDSSRVNIGVFMKWTKQELTKSWSDQIGLRTTIPITPLN